jgi:hypothetical protein
MSHLPGRWAGYSHAIDEFVDCRNVAWPTLLLHWCGSHSVRALREKICLNNLKAGDMGYNLYRFRSQKGNFD